VIGTSVLTPTFRYHPAIVAQAFALLGCLYPGRVVLGVGSGESMNEVPLGIEWPDSKQRFARFREALKLIRALWADERVTFEGECYRTDRATIYDRPEQPGPDLDRVLRPRGDSFRGPGRVTAGSPHPARIRRCTRTR
jgi:coenzyme F420-dependent glucose-6-phosphate dehydrogenase